MEWYYYDAPPFTRSKQKPLNGGKHDFSRDPLTLHNQTLLADLKHSRHFALRLGEVRFRGWQLNKNCLSSYEDEIKVTSSDIQPALQQKGVDMRIGLDITSLSLKKGGQRHCTGHR